MGAGGAQCRLLLRAPGVGRPHTACDSVPLDTQSVSWGESPIDEPYSCPSLAQPPSLSNRVTTARVQGNDVGGKLEYMLSTGNLQSRGGLDMSQATGFTIVAERLNFVRWALLLLGL